MVLLILAIITSTRNAGTNNPETWRHIPGNLLVPWIGSSSWKAAFYLDTQEIPDISWQPKIYGHVYKHFSMFFSSLISNLSTICRIRFFLSLFWVFNTSYFCLGIPYLPAAALRIRSHILPECVCYISTSDTYHVQRVRTVLEQRANYTSSDFQYYENSISTWYIEVADVATLTDSLAVSYQYKAKSVSLA